MRGVKRNMPINSDGANMEAAAPAARSLGTMFQGSGIQVDKLEGVADYNTWKFTMRMALTIEGLWDCVDGTDAVDAARDQRAPARICLGVRPVCYQYVREVSTAKEAWCKLKEVFEDKGLYRRVLLLRRLHRAEYNNYSNMTEYIESVMTLVQQLADIGCKIDDGEVAEMLLSGLPQDYDVLVSGLETACITHTLSTELVRTRLLQEEFRKNSADNAIVASSNQAYYSKKNKSSVICKYCNRAGHIKSKCLN